MTNTAGSQVVPNLFQIDVGINAQPILVDLDGDGILDVLVNGVNNVRTWNYYASRTQYQANTFSLFNSATSLTFADIDGDGDADAIGVAANGGLLYYRNDRLGQFTSLTGNANPFGNLSVSAGSQVTFVNGHLIATSANGTMQQFSLQFSYFGQRTWQARGSFDFTGIDLGPNARPTFTDFDGDGDLDIVVGGADGKIRYYESFRGKFYQQSEKYNPFQKINNSNRSNASPTIVDIDGNGTLDLIVGKGDGTIEQHRDMIAQFYRPVRKAAIFEKPRFVMANFAVKANRWLNFGSFPRHLADVNGDGWADIVGFGETAVVVALGKGDGTFGTPTNVLNGFTPKGGGWTSFDRFPRQLADVNGDGRADIVGFGETSVVVALGQANGTFGTPTNVLNGFTPKGGGWNSFDRNPRQLADVNGDGRADIVGFGETAVAVALGQANGTFGTPFNAIIGFTPGAGRWTSFDRFPRQLADVNGDGRADIVGFGESGVVVALGQANGTFGTPISAFTGFTTGAGRWLTYNQFPRQMGDINGDGRADIVGFGESGVFVALGQLDGTFIAPHQYNTLNAFTVKAGLWTNFDPFPRQVVDLNKDGLADVVGFGESGVFVALNQTPQFSRNIDLLFELDFKTSGQSIWGDSPAKYGYSNNHSLSVRPNFNSLSMDAGVFSGSIRANVETDWNVNYQYDLDLGSLDATLPIQTWFDLPEQIQPGQTIVLKSGYQLTEAANFLTTSPHLKAALGFESRIAVRNAAVSVSAGIGGVGYDHTWDLPNVQSELTLFNIKADSTTGVEMTGVVPRLLEEQKRIRDLTTGQFISEANLIDITFSGPNAGTQGKYTNATTIVGYSDTKLLQANLDLDYLTAQVLRQFPKTKQYGDALAKIEGSAEVDLGLADAYASWNLLDVEFSNRLGLATSLMLQAQKLAGVLTLEDGRRQTFTVGEDLTFNVGADLNGDGFINMSATVALEATVRNRTALTYQGAVDLTLLEASGEISTPLGSASGSAGPLSSRSLPLPGLNHDIFEYNKTFTLGGFNSQSFNFAVAVNNRV